MLDSVETLEDRTLLSGGLPYPTPSTVSQLTADIVYANSNAGSYAITLASNTTFDFTSANNTTNGANALPVITGDITIVGNGDTLEHNSGAPAFRLFDVASGSLALENLTLTGGLAVGTGAAAEGGGIFIAGGTVKLSNDTLSNNAAGGISIAGTGLNGGNGTCGYGGGLYVVGGTVTLINDTLSNNTAYGTAGGFGFSGTATPSGNGGTGGNGGNGANGYGGGLYLAGGTVNLSNDTLSNNNAWGGYAGWGGNGGPGGFSSGSGFSGRTGGKGGNAGDAGSGFGGGLYVLSAIVTLNNDTLSNNQADGGQGGQGGTGGRAGTYRTTHGGSRSDGKPGSSGASSNGGNAFGGGIYSSGGTLDLSNDTLINNNAAGTSRAGGGIDNGSDLLLHNTLIAGNGAGGDISGFPGFLESASDYNLIGDGSGGLSTANHNLLGSSASPINPLLAPLGNYGGPTQTMALLPGSPAINAGSSAYGGSTDQRGEPRVGTTDIGAFESQGFSIAISSGNDQSALLNTAFAQPLDVSVTANNALEPVAGGLVTFTAPASGASAALSGSPATIGSDGNASVTATANGTAGTYTVSASATGIDSPASFSLTNLSSTTYVVSSAADDGSAGTLRYAINSANAPGSPITQIDFDIGSAGTAQIINLTSALPALTASGVYINGLSQGGNGNTKQLIALNGSGTGNSDGLLLQGSSCTVSGLTLENFAENGIEVEGSNDTIGGSVTGAGNVISGNTQDGILLDSTASGTVVQGDSIGVNAAGAAQANGGYGISIAGTNNTIGGTAYRARNIIAGNTKDGVLLASSASGNLLLGNLIGINIAGNAVANSVGVEIAGTNNTISGIASGSRNIISGNSNDGVLIDSTASSNQVLGNYIGTNLYGSAALGNGSNGIEVAGNGNILGSTNAAANNVISGNSNDGVLLDSGASGNQVLGDFIGTDYTGTTAIANKIGIEDAGNNNTLGGSVVGARNVISGNSGDGVLLDSPSSGETVQGNFMGLNKEGTAALANGGNGIEIQGTNNTIGGNSGTDYFTRNFLTGNGNDGVLIDSGGSGNQVLGNFIGVDISGSHGLGNVGNGVEISGSSNNIGGTTVGLGNTISGSSKDGMLLGSTATGNLVQGNDIGTDYTGTKGLGNSSNGIEVSGVNNTLGGTTAGAGNVIAANSNNGVQIDSGASGTLVQGNYIGTNAAGGSLGNGGNGVSISGNNNTIGGNAYRAANTIGNNTGDGVLVSGGTGNSLLRNSIYANSESGISLANGGNDNVAAPSITSASY